MNKDELKFKIDQLRKDKMIYALESISTSLAMFFMVAFISFALPKFAGRIALVGILIAVGYWLFTVYGNTRRLMQIKKLEKRLKE